MEILSNSEFWSKTYECTKSAQSIEPINALIAIESFDIEIPFVLKNDDIEKIYIELKKDFEWLDSFYSKLERGLNKSLNVEEVEELVGLCKWIINTTNDWTKESDPCFKNIAVCLIIIACLNTNVWIYIKSDIDNTCLINDLIPQIINSNFHLSTKNSIHIWEREAINNMNLAIEQRNWLNIANNWITFKSWGFHEYKYVFVKEIFQFANIFSQDKVLDTMKLSNDFLLMNIMFDSDTFSINYRLLLALNTTNNLFRFALLFSLELEKIVLSDKQEILMAEILSNISVEIETAREWFFIFNRYLVRFDFFSGAFGLYLAKYSDEVGIDIYLKSLGNDSFSENHNSYSVNREILTKVFRKFDSIAEVVRRHILWKKVYDKYLEEGLVGINGSKFMNGICYSVLDYAIVKYYTECLDLNELKQLQILKNKELKDISIKWWINHSDMLSNFYYSISLLQPIYHSLLVTKNDLEVLQSKTTQYIPPLLLKDKKTCLKFNFKLQN